MIRAAVARHGGVGEIEIDLRSGRSGLEVPKRLELDSSNTVLTMVSAGLGWARTGARCRGC